MHCPFCGNANITTIDNGRVGFNHATEITCLNCKRVSEVYELPRSESKQP